MSSYYQLFEWQHAALAPWRAAADMARLSLNNPLNPLGQTPFGKNIEAGLDLFERTTRRYGKPEFGIPSVDTSIGRVPVREVVVWERPFCRLVHFEKPTHERLRGQPKVLLVAPLSGHYATLLRGTVETMLPRHDVYITDWADARMVPLSGGAFDLDDFIDYIVSMLHFLRGDTNVIAVCQPAVPVFAATALMEAADDPYVPATITLMGGPIDTRQAPTAVNKFAEEKGIDWFQRNTIMRVPFPHPGFMREVYPGFLQLSGFMGLNLERHMTAHADYFKHLVDGDGDGANKHREFYDEYLAVLDMTAEFYMQTVDTVFIRHALPKGQMTHRGRPVDPKAIRRVAMLTVEGERDDISGVGQTRAAHALAPNIPDERRAHYLQERVGHYGVFNGSRFRAEIAPRIADFIRSAAYKPPAASSRAATAQPKAQTVPKVKAAAAAKPTRKIAAKTRAKPVRKSRKKS